MKIYNYQSGTGEFLSEGVADPDPLEGVNEETGEPNAWLMPALATTIKPPAYKPGNVVVFREGKWGYVKMSDGPEGELTDAPHPPNGDDIAEERNRRLALGFFYDFGDDRGENFFGTTAEDMAGWDEVTKLANAMIMSGAMDTDIQIMTGTRPVTVSALEWQNVLIRAGEVRQPLFGASFILQAMNPIPSDYKDDKYWPDQPMPKVVEPHPGVGGSDDQ